MRQSIHISIILCSFVMCQLVSAATGFKGIVYEGIQNKPVVGAQVVATTESDIEAEQYGIKLNTKTDVNGRYTISNALPNKKYAITVVLKDSLSSTVKIYSASKGMVVLIRDTIFVIRQPHLSITPQQGQEVIELFYVKPNSGEYIALPKNHENHLEFRLAGFPFYTIDTDSMPFVLIRCQNIPIDENINHLTQLEGKTNSNTSTVELGEQRGISIKLRAIELGESKTLSNLDVTIYKGTLYNGKALDFDTLYIGAYEGFYRRQMFCFGLIDTQKVKDRHELDARKIKEKEAFLLSNKAREGVITTASGLQYEIIKGGNGPKPMATDKVKVNYVGTLINGKEFDNSIKRGQPAEFPVDKVIRGWSEVLQLMPVGSKYRVVIPADLAYGTSGAGKVIGPNEILVFELELLDIIK